MILTGLNSRCQEGYSGCSRAEPISLPVPASRDDLDSLTPDAMIPTSASIITFPSLTVTLLPPFYEGPLTT